MEGKEGEREWKRGRKETWKKRGPKEGGQRGRKGGMARVVGRKGRRVNGKGGRGKRGKERREGNERSGKTVVGVTRLLSTDKSDTFMPAYRSY